MGTAQRHGKEMDSSPWLKASKQFSKQQRYLALRRTEGEELQEFDAL